MPVKARDLTPGKRSIDELVKRAQSLSGLKSRQEILSHALQIFLQHLEQKKLSGQPKSFYELTKHLAGSVDGPSDLAHNKKHMEGFGQ
ncbi:MAG: type II toxin-antitoxin system VapB family antitoxin [candidate division KSB1 bacterium]|nr:type II toxin-antitoxin system VapB family antitoxin [candidate division KSB1 bacterium]MDZ7301347.1 type II toxin-antitoxin system VapB family antitoxin [candidate division KSB1 bacterium]MDZ7310768.1 type II toxin-antitoxin system VapB family antitoxin [candidate division KSB1 bacterium]